MKNYNLRTLLVESASMRTTTSERILRIQGLCKGIIFAILTLLYLCTSTAARASSLVLDGGFEGFLADNTEQSYSIPDTIGAWNVFSSGQTGFIELLDHSIRTPGSVDTLPSGGIHFAHIGSKFSLSGISQAISTASGTSYHLSLSASSYPNPAGNSILQIDIDDGNVAAQGSAKDGDRLHSLVNLVDRSWSSIDVMFTAISPTTTISFSSPTSNDPQNLDNIEVFAVPEPTSLLLGLSALGVLALLRRANMSCT